MSLKAKVSEDLKTAMKEKNAVKLGILRVLKAEVERNEQTSGGKVDLTDGEIVKLVKKLVDSIKETTNDAVEIQALEVYLPKQMTEHDINLVIGVVKKSGISSMGEIMKYFKSYHDGQYDGKLLSDLVKKAI
jgi:uncharacterized protein YqeY